MPPIQTRPRSAPSNLKRLRCTLQFGEMIATLGSPADVRLIRMANGRAVRPRKGLTVIARDPR